MRWEALPLACVFLCACGPDRSGSHPDGGSGSDGGPDGGVEERCEPSEIVACTPTDGSDGADGVIVRGTVIAPDRLICSGDVLYSRSRGTIECVSEDCSADPAAAGAPVVCADVITPGLIGAHEHDGYNTLPRFQHEGTLYGDKTDWQGNAAYRAFVDASDAIRTPYLCEIGKWAEVRHILGGATSLMGNQGGNGGCLQTLARDLDVTGANGVYPTSANYVAVMSFIDQGDAANIRTEMSEGLPFVIHVGEGVTQEWRYDEWSDLLGLDLLYPQTTIVHGTAFSAAQLADMGVLGADLAWSPRSNIDLYGLTTPVTIAHHLGSLVSLGSDWTPSGSMNLVEELRCADHLNRTYFDHTFSERQLLEMVTKNPARAFLIDDKVGALASGLLADLAVFRGDRTRPFRAILDGKAGDVALVVVGGQAVYGDRAILVDQGLEPGASCEDLEVCGQNQRVCVKSAEAGDPDKLDQTLAAIKTALEGAIAAARPADCGTSCYAYELMPLFDCDSPEPTEVCTPILDGAPTRPSAGDADGDQVADNQDLCPRVFDPLFDGAAVQGDLDGDGRGDACDVCPADADDGCTDADADGDGVANAVDLCPLRRDASQTDEDADGLGDACDACPGDGDRACTSLRSIRDPRDPFHPNPGSQVHVSGLVVTAVKSSAPKGRQIWVQEPGASEFGGIVLFYGSGTLPTGIAEGQTVDVRGTYEEFFDLSEITSPTVTITTPTPTPLDPVTVEAAMIATGGARAEALESMLVTVAGVTVMNASPDNPDRDEFQVSSNLRVDDLILDGCDPGSTAAACMGVAKTWGMSVGSVYTITGVVSYSFSNSKLLPRSKVSDFDPDAP